MYLYIHCYICVHTHTHRKHIIYTHITQIQCYMHMYLCITHTRVHKHTRTHTYTHARTHAHRRCTTHLSISCLQSLCTYAHLLSRTHPISNPLYEYGELFLGGYQVIKCELRTYTLNLHWSNLKC